MVEKVFLTATRIKNLPAAEPGKRYSVNDSDVPGLQVRVTGTGAKSFVFFTRFPGKRTPERRLIGKCVSMTVDEAREVAREWRRMIDRGLDPREEAERLRREAEEEERRRIAEEEQGLFDTVMDDYLTRHIAKTRRAREAENRIRRTLLPAWSGRSTASITKADVVKLVEKIADENGLYEAHAVFGHIRTFFNWAINRGIYGLPDHSPCDRLRVSQLVGAKKPRQRRLSEEELFAYWRATRPGRSPRRDYPWAPFMRFLLLTGTRREEAAAARWREFHPELVRLLRKRKDGEQIDWKAVPADIKLWTVGAARFKSDAPHMVCLSDAACVVLEGLPHFSRGQHLFSTTGGEKPISGFSRAKKRLDAAMLRTLRALARQRGEEEAELPGFVLHDLRRCIRSELARLRVPDEVAEMCIGHGRKGLQRVYDQHRYIEEMRAAMEAWADRLAEIVAPDVTSGKVVSITTRRAL